MRKYLLTFFLPLVWKRPITAAIVLALTFGLLQSVAFAEKGCGYDKGGHYKKSFKDMFFKKVGMIYRYQDELDVSDKQMDKVKDLKIALKKDLIKKDADVDIIKIDIMSLMHEDKIDLDAVNKFVDQKYKIKKAKSKKIIASCAELKKILSKDQMDKLKALFMQQKEMHPAK